MADDGNAHIGAAEHPQDGAEAPVVGENGDVFDVEAYSLVRRLGEGGYSEVWKAWGTRSQDYVALKRLRLLQETPALGIRMLRETKILRHLHGHEDIIGFRGVLMPPNPGRFRDMLTVFEVMPRSLRQILKHKPMLRPRQVCALMFQLVRGVRFMHLSGVIHRDLKPSNLLVDHQTGKLKIIDFGLSRVAFKPSTIVTWADVQLWTTKVATLRYRPPELLLVRKEKTFYNAAADVWSMGCIFGEMLLGRPLFTGNNEKNVMLSILQTTGMPTEYTIRRLASCEAREVVLSAGLKYPIADFTIFPRDTDTRALDLVKRMLKFDPLERPSAAELLEDEYFSGLLAKEGYGKAPVSFNEADFEFEELPEGEPTIHLGTLYDNLMGEVTLSMDAIDCGAPAEILRYRSQDIIQAMDSIATSSSMNRRSDQPPTPDGQSPRERYQHLPGAGTR